MVQQRLRRHGIAADGRPPAAVDVGFLEADLFTRVAQPVGVVQVDTGDDGAIGIDNVHGVQATAQADLQHHGVQPGLRKEAQDGQGGEFEIGQRDLAAGGFNRLELGDQRLVRGDLAIDAGSFVEVDQVGRSVEPDLVAGREQDRFQHGTGGPLAIGAADDELHPGQRQPHPAGHFPHPVQPHVDGSGVDRFQVLQPIGQGGGGVGRAGRRHDWAESEISLQF